MSPLGSVSSDDVKRLHAWGNFHRYPALVAGLGFLGSRDVTDSNDDALHGSRLYQVEIPTTQAEDERFLF
jgi:hypothetical protein